MKLQIKAGDGLTFDGNDLTVNCGDNVSIVNEEGQTGLFVNDLKGPDGDNGGSGADEWTVKKDQPGWTLDGSGQIDDFIDVDRSVVNLIFEFGLYKVANHGGNGIQWSTTVKTVSDMIDELNYPISAKVGSVATRNRTSYRPLAGEMIELVTSPSTRQVYYGNTSTKVWVEAMTRLSSENQETKAMFVIKSITYENKGAGVETYWVEKMTLACIYSTLSQFEVGKDYSGQTTLNE